MAFALKERPDSRRVRYGTRGGGETLLFNGRGSDDQVAIYTAVVGIADGQPGGPTWDGFIRQDIEVELLGGGRSKVTVEYGDAGFGGGGVPTGTTPGTPTAPGGGSGSPGAADAALGPGYSFDLSAETLHVTQSIETLARVAVGGGVAPNNQQAIGLTKERVEGCDVFGPKFDWSRAVARATVTRAYMRTLRNLVGKKNNAVFYTSAAGEVLYLGASGQFTGQGWTITHKFSERENITNKFIVRDPAAPNNPAAPLALVIPAAKGWDYVWVAYENEIRNDEVAPRPYAAYVEKVIEDGDFGLIGIGT